MKYCLPIVAALLMAGPALSDELPKPFGSPEGKAVAAWFILDRTCGQRMDGAVLVHLVEKAFPADGQNQPWRYAAMMRDTADKVVTQVSASFGGKMSKKQFANFCQHAREDYDVVAKTLPE